MEGTMSQDADLAIIADTNLEIKRLKWTNERGQAYLIFKYGVQSRSLLTRWQSLEFLEHLRSLPTPEM